MASDIPKPWQPATLTLRSPCVQQDNDLFPYTANSYYLCVQFSCTSSHLLERKIGFPTTHFGKFKADIWSSNYFIQYSTKVSYCPIDFCGYLKFSSDFFWFHQVSANHVLAQPKKIRQDSKWVATAITMRHWSTFYSSKKYKSSSANISGKSLWCHYLGICPINAVALPARWDALQTILTTETTEWHTLDRIYTSQHLHNLWWSNISKGIILGEPHLAICAIGISQKPFGLDSPNFIGTSIPALSTAIPDMTSLSTSAWKL